MIKIQEIARVLKENRGAIGQTALGAVETAGGITAILGGLTPPGSAGLFMGGYSIAGGGVYDLGLGIARMTPTFKNQENYPYPPERFMSIFAATVNEIVYLTKDYAVKLKERLHRSNSS